MNAHSDEKLQKVRKGTHSCRECRRRKVRCIFASPTDATCIVCRRRGARCVSQAVDNRPTSPTPSLTLHGRSVVIADQFINQDHVGNDGPLLTPSPSSHGHIVESTIHPEIIRALHRALPLRSDIEILPVKVPGVSTFGYQSNFKSDG